MANNSFKFFNYDKPGKGVSKNHDKRPYIEFWELFLRKFWDLLELGLLYLIFAVPLVTIGLGTAGATYITRNFAREKPVFLISDFFSTMKKNWKQALPIGILNTIITIIMIFSAYFYYCYSSLTGIILMAMVLCLLLLFTIMQYYIYIMMVTFKYSFKQLYKNAFYMTFLGVKSNLIIIGTLIMVYGLIISLAMTLIFSNLQAIGMLILTFGFLLIPAFRLLLIQFYVFPVIKKYLIDPYYKENPEEFEAVRHYLNLENEETKKQDEEKAIFHEIDEKNNENSDSDSSKKSIPKQYSENELRGKGRNRNFDDDDDTI